MEVLNINNNHLEYQRTAGELVWKADLIIFYWFLFFCCRLVLCSLSEQWRHARGGGAFKASWSWAAGRKAHAPLLRRSATSLRPPAENRWRHPRTRRLRTVRSEGLHPLPRVRGRGWLQEAGHGEVRSIHGFHFRAVPHFQTVVGRMELVLAPVFEVSCLSLISSICMLIFVFFCVCRKITRGGTVMISPEYELTKKRLYRSACEEWEMWCARGERLKQFYDQRFVFFYNDISDRIL